MHIHFAPDAASPVSLPSPSRVALSVGDTSYICKGAEPHKVKFHAQGSELVGGISGI